jgi:hypothetical protein
VLLHNCFQPHTAAFSTSSPKSSATQSDTTNCVDGRASNVRFIIPPEPHRYNYHSLNSERVRHPTGKRAHYFEEAHYLDSSTQQDPSRCR